MADQSWLDALVQSLKEGDSNAGPLLVSQVAPHLMGYAAVVGRDLSSTDRELAVELAVERAVRHVDRFDKTKGTFLAWLRGFVRHALGDVRRFEGRHEELRERHLEVMDEGSDDEPNPRAAAIMRLAAYESADVQSYLALRFWEQRPHEQVAAEFGITVAASRKRQQRILERLRDAALAEPELADLIDHDQGPQDE